MITLMSMTLDTPDWIVLAVYLLATFGIAIYARFGQRNIADLFLAGRSMPFVVVAISLYATLFSTISFVGVPGEAYRNGVLTSLNSLGYAIFTPLAVWLFLRFFYKTGQTFTAYEYLGHRFSGGARTLGSVVFLVARGLYGATVFYAAANIFQPLVGWEPTTVIIFIGVFSVAYTTIGGMRAVMITDVVQTVVILIGLAVILLKASSLIGYDFAGLWNHAVEHNRGFSRVATAEFYSFDPHVRYTFWVFLVMSIMTPLQHYGTDQLVVQRFLASRSYDAARRAIFLKTLFTPILMMVFFLVGLLLFYYYSTIGTLPEGLAADQVMGHFIVSHLPSPMPGLIAAALVASLMSSVDSTVGSLSTVTCIDLLKRGGWFPEDEAKQVRVGKRLTIMWGVLVIALALLLTHASAGTSSMVFEMIAVWGSLWGVLLVVMVAGVLTRWATAKGAVAALAVGMAINLTWPWYLYLGTPPEDRISFAWVGMPGVIVTAVVLVVVSAFTRERGRNLDNLVLGESTSDRISPAAEEEVPA